MSETTGDDAVTPDAPSTGGVPEPPEPPEPEPSDAGWPDTSVLTPPPTAPAEAAPTVVPEPATTPLGVTPTTVDPLVPPPTAAPPAPPVTAAPPVAPSWPSPSGAAPGWPAPSVAAPGWPGPDPDLSAGYPPPAPPGPPPPTYASTYPPAYAPGAYAGPGYPAGGLPGVAGWGAVPQAPKPGVIPLRPLSVGEILDGAISYIRRDPKTVLGISALIAAAIALLQLLLYGALSSWLGPVFSSTGLTTGDGATAEAAFENLGGGIVGVVGIAALVAVGSYLLEVLATGLLTSVMGRAILGRPVSTSDAWRRASRRFWPLLGLTLLVSLILGGTVFGGLAVSVLVGIAIGQASTGLGIAVGLVLAVATAVLAVWLYVKLLLAPVALILEDTGVVTSMRRSFRLVTTAWWRTFGINLLAVIIASVVAEVLTIPFSIISGATTFFTASNGSVTDPFSFGQSLTGALATLVSQTIVVPFSAGVVALLYVDRRIRREALDIELARAASTPG